MYYAFVPFALEFHYFTPGFSSLAYPNLLGSKRLCCCCCMLPNPLHVAVAQDGE
jgi:hypothetical protein